MVLISSVADMSPENALSAPTTAGVPFIVTAAPGVVVPAMVIEGLFVTNPSAGAVTASVSATGSGASVCEHDAEHVPGASHRSCVSESVSSQSASVEQATTHTMWEHDAAQAPGFEQTSLVSGFSS
jgi:hypothetical protein